MRFRKISPFCGQILESFPFIAEDFDQMTEYALYCKLKEKVDQIRIGVNNLGDDVAEYIAKFDALKNYVDNYFDNLDVQDEINNKLNEMAEDGTLQEIMASYLETKAVFGFNTITDLKEATNLNNGSYAKTLGFYAINDGGGANYKIRTITNADTINDIDLIALTNNNTLVAELIIDEDSLNILKLGCKGDNTFDNTDRIQRGIDLTNNIYIPCGKFLISDTIIYKRYTKITGENKVDSVLVMDANESNTILQSYNFNTLKGNPSPAWQWDDSTICFFEFRDFRVDGNYRDSTNQVNKQSGNGIEVYGASFILDNIYIDNCAGVGLYLEWTNPETAQTYFRAGNQIAKIDVDINNCGEEGLINDLGDCEFRRLFMGNCGIKGTSTHMDSITECHSVVMEKGCEIGEWHIYGGTKGYGIYLNTTTRFRCQSLIIESCCGGLYVSNTTHYGQITNLQIHNMMYTNSNYNDEFRYIDFNGTRPFLITNCSIQEYADSEDLDLIYITGVDLSIYNLWAFTNIHKTKSVIRGNTNNEGYFGRTTIKGNIENCNLVLKGTVGNACNIELNVINCNRVVEPTFTIGVGSKVRFTGQLYNNQKFAETLLNTTPRRGCFSMNMRIGDTDNIYPGLTSTIIPDLTTANTNKFNSLTYNLPFKLDPNDLIFYMYKLTEGTWGDVNITIVTRDQQVNSSGIPYAPIKYIYSGTNTSEHDYRIIGKYGL